MDGQEEAAICLGEVSDSGGEAGKGGWPRGWGSGERELGARQAGEGEGRVSQLAPGAGRKVSQL